MPRGAARMLRRFYLPQPVVAVFGLQAGAGACVARQRAASCAVGRFESAVYFLQQRVDVAFHSGDSGAVKGLTCRRAQAIPAGLFA